MTPFNTNPAIALELAHQRMREDQRRAERRRAVRLARAARKQR